MKRNIAPIKIISILVFWLLTSAVVLAAPPRTVVPPPISAGYELNVMEQKAVLLLNEDRRSAGLEALKINL